MFCFHRQTSPRPFPDGECRPALFATPPPRKVLLENLRHTPLDATSPPKRGPFHAPRRSCLCRVPEPLFKCRPFSLAPSPRLLFLLVFIAPPLWGTPACFPHVSAPRLAATSLVF